MRNSLFLPGILLLILLSGCVARYLPRPAKIGLSPYGALIQIKDTKHHQYIGELIAADTSKLIVLTVDLSKSKVYVIPKKNTFSYKVHYAQPKGYGIVLASSGILLPFMHGFFAVFSIPANFLDLCIVLGTADSEYTYKPNELPYNKLYEFARYPQGLPPGMDTFSIQTPRY